MHALAEWLAFIAAGWIILWCAIFIMWARRAANNPDQDRNDDASPCEAWPDDDRQDE